MSSHVVRSRQFISPPYYLRLPATGISISKHSIKALTLDPSFKTCTIKNHAEVPLPEGAIEDGEIKKGNVLIRLLKKLKDDLRISFVRVGIPEEKVFLFTVILPVLSKDEIRDALYLQLGDYVPLPPDQVVFDFDIVSFDEKGIEVSVTAIPETVITQYELLFEEADLTPLSFEVEAQAIARAVIPRDDMGTYMIIDIGKSRTGISIVERTILRYTSTLSLGGDMFTSAIAHSLEIPTKEAEAIKCEIGFSKKDPRLYEALVNAMSVLKDEVRIRLDFWENKGKEKKYNPIQGIVVCGGGANMPGIVEHISSYSGIKTVLANVWINAFSIRECIPDLPLSKSLAYASLVGLSLSKEL